MRCRWRWELLETWASAAREAVSWGLEEGQDYEVIVAGWESEPGAVGSQAARGAHPFDVHHHESEGKGVELTVCFSLGMFSCPGVGTAELLVCVIHAGVRSEGERRGS